MMLLDCGILDGYFIVCVPCACVRLLLCGVLLLWRCAPCVWWCCGALVSCGCGVVLVRCLLCGVMCMSIHVDWAGSSAMLDSSGSVAAVET